ncbi:MAG TPA: hypothetical protein VFH39_04140 [Candidatus Saccharimonadales bacterium]|nr:hypothetical protein [Candidatus Saccharimonadales bacterium]
MKQLQLAGDAYPSAVNRFATPRHIAMLGAAAISGPLAVDMASSYVFWHGRHTEVIADTAEATVDQPRSLAVPGLANPTGEFLTTEFGDLLPGAKDYLSFSDYGISAKKVGRALGAHYGKALGPNNTEGSSQNVICHSMGLLTFLMGAEYCKRKRLAVPPIDTMIAVSPLLDASHTYFEKHIKFLARFPYPGGVLSKFCIELYQRCEAREQELSNLSTVALTALRNSHTGFSPILWGQQVRTGAYKPSSKYLEGVFTPNTKMYVVGDPEETTVKVLAAVEACKAMVAPFGTSVTFVPAPGAGHSDMRIAADALRQHEDFSAKVGPTTAYDRIGATKGSIDPVTLSTVSAPEPMSTEA